MGIHPAIRCSVEIEERDSLFIVVVVENGRKTEFRCKLRRSAEVIAAAHRRRFAGEGLKST